MNDLLRLILFLLGYVVLMKWVLPRLGVPTCLSGACAVPARPKQSVERESELASNSKPTPER
jgi:hypothetical protein